MPSSFSDSFRSRPWLLPIVVGAVSFVLGALIFSGGSPSDAPANADGGTTAEVEKKAEVWTCSMHPQIKMPKRGLCPICAMDLIPLKESGSSVGPREISLSPSARKLAHVETTEVKRQVVKVQVPLVGKVVVDERKVAEISARFPGRLDRLYIDYTGTLVRAGDHLAQVYSPDLLTAQSELISASKRASKASGLSADIAKRTLSAARDKLQRWGLSQEQIEAIEKKTKPSHTLQIDSPIGGIVTKKEVNEGDYVKEGSPMFQVAELKTVWVMLDAYEADLPWISFGQPVTFESESYPGKIFKGSVAFISPMLDDKTRTAQVRVNVDNPEMRLKPGMFVRGMVKSAVGAGGKVVEDDLADKWISPMHPEIVKDKPGNCDICGMELVKASELGFVKSSSASIEKPLVIPATEVMFTGRRSVVYVEKPTEDQVDSVFEGREVTLGPRAGDYYVVKHGLKEGERVVTRGSFRIDSALQIVAKPSMMSMEGGPVDEADVNNEALDALEPVLAVYLDIRAALAGDDLAKAKEQMAAMGQAVSNADADAFGDARPSWEKGSAALADAAKEVEGVDDINDLRTRFLAASTAMVDLVRTVGNSSDKAVVKAHCPMAFGGKGGDWLQPAGKLGNPYYGKSMLTCGATKEEFAGR